MLASPIEKARKIAEDLLLSKGYSKDEILPNYLFKVELPEGEAIAIADILVKLEGRNAIVVMCAPPTALVPYERLALACARVLNAVYAIALNVEEVTVMRASDGKICRGFECIPHRNEFEFEDYSLSEDRLEKEKRILVTYLNILHCVGCEIFRNIQKHK